MSKKNLSAPNGGASTQAPVLIPNDATSEILDRLVGSEGSVEERLTIEKLIQAAKDVEITRQRYEDFLRIVEIAENYRKDAENARAHFNDVLGSPELKKMMEEREERLGKK